MYLHQHRSFRIRFIDIARRLGLRERSSEKGLGSNLLCLK